MKEPAKTIVYTCPYVPAEWIAAHGLTPRRLIPLPDESEEIVARAQGLCPYARAFANDAAASSDVAGIVVTTLCDQMRRVYDLLTRRVDVPTFLLNVPKTWQTVAAAKLYLDELNRLRHFLVRLGGQTPTDEELAQVMIEYDNVGSCIADIAKTDGVPVTVVGGPLMQKDRSLFNVIEECGGCVVLDATETGRRGQRRAFDRRRLTEDPVMELAQAYFGIPDASRRPNSELYRWLERELAQSAARGIIFHHYIWCDSWRAELGRLKEWTHLPVLGIDSDGHGQMSLARSQNRIRAFLEMLQ